MRASANGSNVRSVENSLGARSVAKVFFVILGLSAVLYLVYLTRHTLMLVVVAGFLALALDPPVNFISRRARFPRSLAIVTVYLLIVVAIVAIGLFLVPSISSGVNNLAKDLPGQLRTLLHQQWIQDLNRHYHVIDNLESSSTHLPKQLSGAVRTLEKVTIGAFSAAVQLVVVLVLAFLFVLEGPSLLDWCMRQLPEHQQTRWRHVVEDVHDVVVGYVAGSAAISLTAGVFTYLLLSLLGIPFAAPLAVLMAFLDLIPIIGPVVGATVIALATLLGHFPRDTIVWVVVFVTYHQIENYVYRPLVFRRTIEVHPFVVIISVLAGVEMLGVLGALLAIPFAAALQVVVKDWWATRDQGSATAPTSLGAT